ncbi:hypothetical protein [Dinghuibacter silviterrae]|uniref:TerB family tellurite resistance protein n=1 Tax=Dinghuibacter silviterrae TaxID=1539049 RepID=A0A4R8DRP1_9BACT|nr:hypothetical protein [Dinghuibacter silviterrae]TDX00506.1 hypothetical protein EDB95_1531 [Dinghuibacter silviterrae]
MGYSGMKWTRRTLSLLFLACWAAMVQGQSVAGSFFTQKETQISDYLKQILAYQVYITYLRKGYDIVKNGTGTISKMKNGDLSLQTAFYDSLKMVNPSIRNYAKVNAIVATEQELSGERSGLFSQLSASGQFTGPELASLKNTFVQFATAGTTDLEELRLLVTDGQMQMNDNERIAGIDHLYDKVMRSCLAQRRMDNSVQRLMTERRLQGRDAGDLGQLLETP